MLQNKYYIKTYIKDVAIVENERRETTILNLSDNQVLAKFDSFFSFENINNRLIFQYKLNGVRLFDIKDKKIIFDDANTIVPYRIYKTCDGKYHCIDYLDFFDVLEDYVFLELKEIEPGIFEVKNENITGYYTLENGFLTELKPNFTYKK